jgi:hypothetical protein
VHHILRIQLSRLTRVERTVKNTTIIVKYRVLAYIQMSQPTLYITIIVVFWLLFLHVLISLVLRYTTGMTLLKTASHTILTSWCNSLRFCNLWELQKNAQDKFVNNNKYYLHRRNLCQTVSKILCIKYSNRAATCVSHPLFTQSQHKLLPWHGRLDV